MNEELRLELLRRSAADQEARTRAMEAFKIDHEGPIPEETETVLEALRRLDEDNTAWLKAVVREHGWPGRSLVGDEGANAAWLLAQHADRDPAFQRECLDLMQKAVEAGEAGASEWAYLTDRVLRAEGRPQRYGTQFTNALEPQPLEDPDHVDERRASVGLGTLEEYRQTMIAQYGDSSFTAGSQVLATCSSGPLEVRVQSVKLAPGMRSYRPKPGPIKPDVPLPWLPEGCSPCSFGPAFGATRDGEVVLSWYEQPQPPSQPVEVGWPETEDGVPQVEATEAGGRPAVVVTGAEGCTVVIMTADGKRHAVSGTLTRDELLRVAATLPS